VNLAAVHYHFGGKDELIQAVIQRRLGPLLQERLDLLEAREAQAAPGVPRLERILEAFLGPPLRLSADPRGGGAVFMRLLGRIHAEPSELFKKIYCEQFSVVMSRYTAALQRVLPELPAEELYWRLHFLHGVMGHAMCGSAKLKILSGGLCEASDVETLLQRMVPFLAAGMRAPLPKLPSRCGEPGSSDEALDEVLVAVPGSSRVPSQEVSLP
jgi:AcrR family transcriptional regulator